VGVVHDASVLSKTYGDRGIEISVEGNAEKFTKIAGRARSAASMVFGHGAAYMD